MHLMWANNLSIWCLKPLHKSASHHWIIIRILQWGLTVAHRAHIHSLWVKVSFLTSDHLVVLHLSESLLLSVLIVRENASSGLIEGIRTILIVAIPLHTLHIKVASIKAISNIIYIIQQISLCPTRLIVDFNLINKSSSLHLKLRI